MEKHKTADILDDSSRHPWWLGSGSISGTWPAAHELPKSDLSRRRALHFLGRRLQTEDMAALRSELCGWHSVFVSFVVITIVIAFTSGVFFFVSRASQRQGEAMMQNALDSVELVSRMDRDISRRRRLLGEHIAEVEPHAMAKTEEQMAEAVSDYRAAAANYPSLVSFPGEANAWGRLEVHVAALEESIDTVLNLSRHNRDVEAGAALHGLDPQFSAIEGDAAALVLINRTGAQHAIAKVEAVRRRSSIVFTSAFVAQAILTLVVGVWTTSFVRRREEEIRRYADELDAFAGRAAHDLRGPLNNFTLAAKSIGRKIGEEDRNVTMLHRGVERMRVLIEDLLALSRIGALPCDEICDPAVTTEEIHDEVGEKLAADGVVMSLDVQPGRVRCTAGLLRQMIANLVDNAAKYRRTGEPAKIELRGRMGRDRYVLEVSDNGVGMSPDEVRHAFEPFYRAERVRDRQGTGLGLSIVKRIVSACGGTISIDSTLARGTTVRVKVLPG